MWTKNDLMQIQSDVSVIYSSLMKEVITVRSDSFIIDLDSVISVPEDITENMMLYSAASEIFKMCTAEYKNAAHNICVGWKDANMTVTSLIALMDELQKAVYDDDANIVAEKATIFAIFVLRKNK